MLVDRLKKGKRGTTGGGGGPLLAWYDASDFSVADGTAITTWADKSGNGFNLTGAGTVKNSIMNGKPIVRLAGTVGQAMGVLNSAFFMTDFTVFISFIRRSTGNYQGLLNTNSSGAANGWNFGTDASSPTRDTMMVGSGSGNNRFGTTAASVGTPRIMTGDRLSSSNLNRLFINGTLNASVTLGLAYLSAKFQIGTYYNDVLYGAVDIGEIRVYNTRLSDADRETNLSSMGTKWGITVA